MNKQVGTLNGRPTMKDVASRARVALKTVSRVVNGEPGVTPETASRVLGAIEDLGFRRNESARLLRTGHTATLGFIADSWADTDLAAVYRGLEDVARSHGYLLYSGSTDRDPEREERLALAMCARRVDGLIISPASGAHDYLVPEIEAGVATVFVLRPPVLNHADDTDLPADTVLPDERGGGRAAVAHLIAHGHRRIGFLAGGEHRSRELLAGYAEAMRAAGLAADPAWTMLDAASLNPASPDPGSAGHPPVTAVLCADRTSTEAALHALTWPCQTTAESGRVAGAGPMAGSGRVAVIGFGDLELADLVSPGLTVVSYDPTLIGRTAGELLVRRLAGDQLSPRQVEVPVRLIPRGSAEFPPPE
jgi:LacI family transcriptional regulator